MNKIMIAVVALIVLVVGAAGIYKVIHHFTKNQPQAAKMMTNSGIFGSIQDALSKDLTLQCNFTDDAGRQTVSYIKHGQVRADITATDPKQSSSVIVKNKMVYFWNATMGFVMMLPSEAETGSMMKNAAGVTPAASNEGSDMLMAMEKFKDHCKPAVVDDSLFTPPANVKFQDMSKMIPTGMMPSGAMPSGMNQQQLQQYMQQYQQH